MKRLFVSLLLALLTSCDLPTEPPAPRIPRVPDENRPVVIVGRVVSAAGAVGIQAANVRVIEAGASVGTDEKGDYRIVLPARFRGTAVPVQVRAIGFLAQTHIVAIPADTAILNLAMTVHAFGGSCLMEVRDADPRLRRR